MRATQRSTFATQLGRLSSAAVKPLFPLGGPPCLSEEVGKGSRDEVANPLSRVAAASSLHAADAELQSCVVPGPGRAACGEPLPGHALHSGGQRAGAPVPDVAPLRVGLGLLGPFSESEGRLHTAAPVRQGRRMAREEVGKGADGPLPTSFLGRAPNRGLNSLPMLRWYRCS